MTREEMITILQQYNIFTEEGKSLINTAIWNMHNDSPVILALTNYERMMLQESWMHNGLEFLNTENCLNVFEDLLTGLESTNVDTAGDCTTSNEYGQED